MIGVLAGFLPWIVLTALARHGLPVAAGAALGTALAIGGRRLVMGRAKVFEKAGLGFLALIAALSPTSLAPTDPAVISALGNGALAVLAAVSLVVGRPFIAEYAREIEPERVWAHPLFAHGTRRLTQAWTVVLAAMAALQLASAHSAAHAWLLRWGLPAGLLVAAVHGSHVYRRWLRRRNLTSSPAG